MKELPENAYTFRTTTSDDYLKRVASEAATETNFLLISEVDKFAGTGRLFVGVRRPVTLLGVFKPDMKLSDAKLSEWLEQALLQQAENQPTNGKNGTDEFVFMGIEGDFEFLAKEASTVEQQIRALNNILRDRTVQVVVETY